MDGAAALILIMLAVMTVVSCHQVCFIGSEFNTQSGIPHRWFLPYKDPCQCTSIRLGGMNIPASSYRQGAPYYLDYLFLSEDSDEIHAHFNCAPECSTPRPLGIADWTIKSARITASSAQNCCPAYEARLNNYYAWSPETSDPHPWIEVDLTHPTVVSGIITQGGFSIYVTKYHVSYQNPNLSNYEHMRDTSGNIKLFTGNTDVITPVTNMFDESVLATAVRIEPTQWFVVAALRMELLGCRLD